jgi:glycosyltransferase involved in cell wall biosynthesis
MKKIPLISIVVPCVNEEHYIEKCIKSILQNNYPSSKIKILVIDGMSTDNTVEKIKKIQKSTRINLKFLLNRKKSLAAAWNLGIENACGKYLFAMNAHASIKKNYFKRIVQSLEETGEACCGACLTTIPQNKDFFGKVIGQVLSSKIGVGNSKFRTGIKRTEYADSAHMAGYRLSVIKNMRFNEKLRRSQDIEFNSRLRKMGHKILLIPERLIKYYTRSEIKKFPKDMFKNGYWVTRPLHYGCFIAKPRHLVPLFFIFGILFMIGLSIYNIKFIGLLGSSLFVYFLVILFSVLKSFKIMNFKTFLGILVIVPLLHICYGTGSLVGLFPLNQQKEP